MVLGLPAQNILGPGLGALDELLVLGPAHLEILMQRTPGLRTGVPGLDPVVHRVQQTLDLLGIRFHLLSSAFSEEPDGTMDQHLCSPAASAWHLRRKTTFVASISVFDSSMTRGSWYVPDTQVHSLTK